MSMLENYIGQNVLFGLAHIQYFHKAFKDTLEHKFCRNLKFFKATFWFFGHRILMVWTYRISVRNRPWFFHIFRQEISSGLETEILDNGKFQKKELETFKKNLFPFFVFSCREISSNMNTEFPRRISNLRMDRMEMDFWFMGRLDEDYHYYHAIDINKNYTSAHYGKEAKDEFKKLWHLNIKNLDVTTVLCVLNAHHISFNDSD
ncbi:hypothetical protein C1646_661862 [Rhizophagus diaphanus]|nr:hypothetical protein C1646_661862 [Rhizophagus diaphanus] [Rhizophagus sp. MUCL 43196]